MFFFFKVKLNIIIIIVISIINIIIVTIITEDGREVYSFPHNACITKKGGLQGPVSIQFSMSPAMSVRLCFYAHVGVHVRC